MASVSGDGLFGDGLFGDGRAGAIRRIPDPSPPFGRITAENALVGHT
ncbi:hypothetical protein [Streptomyces orinoci]|uniref:Uncharacterized protein n=1 Tax=Streptomyces orinoci TaxID=67339 RepID=A0ABV3K608_STRON